MHNSQKEIERAEIFHCLCPIIDYFFITAENPYDRSGKGQQENSCHDRIKHAHSKSYSQSFPDSVCFSRTIVLTGKSRCCHTKTHYRQNVKPIYFQVCTKTRHCTGSESIDTRLYQYIWKGDYRVLNCSRQTYLDNPSCHCSINGKFLRIYAVNIRNSHQKP